MFSKFFRFHRFGTRTYFGAPLYVHGSVYIAAGVIALFALESPILAAVALASYLGIIVLHEFGHAYVVRRLGHVVTRIDIGWLHGRCYYVSQPYEWHDVLIAWGGVAAQLLVSIPILIIGATGVLDSVDVFGPILIFLGVLNFFMALLNSIPAEGFDGATMWRIVPLWFEIRKTRKPSKPKKRKGPKLRVVGKDNDGQG